MFFEILKYFYNISQGSFFGFTIIPCEVLTFHLTVEEFIHIVGSPANKDELHRRRIRLLKQVCGAILVAVGPRKVQAGHKIYRILVTSWTGSRNPGRTTYGISHCTRPCVQTAEFHAWFCTMSSSPSRILPVLNQMSEECDGLFSRENYFFLLTTDCFFPGKDEGWYWKISCRWLNLMEIKGRGWYNSTYLFMKTN